MRTSFLAAALAAGFCCVAGSPASATPIALHITGGPLTSPSLANPESFEATFSSLTLALVTFKYGQGHSSAGFLDATEVFSPDGRTATFDFSQKSFVFLNLVADLSIDNDLQSATSGTLTAYGFPGGTTVAFGPISIGYDATTVPLPGAASLFGGALLALGLTGSGVARRTASTAL